MTPLLARHQARESGFFHWAQHIDTLGLWIYSSLSAPYGVNQIKTYEAPIRCQDVLKRLNGDPAKYPQKGSAKPWKGVVLPAQIPNDRAIRIVKDIGFDYWKFIARCCVKYRDRLFIKLHPAMRADVTERHVKLAREHGVPCGHANMNCIKNCEFVVLFNSTFAVDAWLHGIPVIQYAPGYFSGTHAVTYTIGKMVDGPEDCGDMPQKMVDFLVWRYCWHQNVPQWWKEEIAKVFESPTELFPLPERLSYAGFLRWCSEQGDYRYVKEGAWPKTA
jgi:hypothetical protein